MTEKKRMISTNWVQPKDEPPAPRKPFVVLTTASPYGKRKDFISTDLPEVQALADAAGGAGLKALEEMRERTALELERLGCKVNRRTKK